MRKWLRKLFLGTSDFDEELIDRIDTLSSQVASIQETLEWIIQDMPTEKWIDSVSVNVVNIVDTMASISQAVESHQEALEYIVELCGEKDIIISNLGLIKTSNDKAKN